MMHVPIIPLVKTHTHTAAATLATEKQRDTTAAVSSAAINNMNCSKITGVDVALSSPKSHSTK